MGLNTKIKILHENNCTNSMNFLGTVLNWHLPVKKNFSVNDESKHTTRRQNGRGGGLVHNIKISKYSTDCKSAHETHWKLKVLT